MPASGLAYTLLHSVAKISLYWQTHRYENVLLPCQGSAPKIMYWCSSNWLMVKIMKIILSLNGIGASPAKTWRQNKGKWATDNSLSQQSKWLYLRRKWHNDMEVSSKPSLFIHSRNDLYGVTLCCYWNAYFNDKCVRCFLSFSFTKMVLLLSMCVYVGDGERRKSKCNHYMNIVVAALHAMIHSAKSLFLDVSKSITNVSVEEL